MKYKINIQLPNNLGDIEYEDDNENAFLQNLERIPDIRQKAISILSEQTPTMVSGEYPNITKPSSVPDAIEKLLSTDWGRMAPRTLHELHSALAVNAVHVTKQALGSKLTKMVRSNRLSSAKERSLRLHSASSAKIIIGGGTAEFQVTLFT